MAKKYGFWSAAGDITGALLAPFTYGASLTLSPTARGLVENVLGGSSDNDNDSINQAQQNYQTQMEQWKLLSEERRQELERLRQKELEKEKQIKRNEEEINSLKSKIDDPNTSEEEKIKLKKRLIVLEDDNKKLKGELTIIRTQIKTKEDEKPIVPTTPSAPWKLPKLSAYDKMLIAAVLVLIIYFLFLREDKKR